MPYDNIYSEFQGYYYRHITTVGFSHFQDAGLDLFTGGVNSNPQSFLQLTNVMPATSGGFKLRWGISTLSSITSAFSPTRVFSYNVAQDATDPSNTAATDLIIATDNQSFQLTKVTTAGAGITGSTWAGYAPVTFPNTGSIYGIESRQWFYYANGVDAPQKIRLNYTTSDTNSNWGFAPPAAFYAPSANLTASTSTASTSGGVGGFNSPVTSDASSVFFGVSGSSDTTITAATAVNVATSTLTAVAGTGKNYSASPTVTISGGGGTGASAVAIVKDGTITGFEMLNVGNVTTTTYLGYTSAPNVEITDGTGKGATAFAVIQNGYVTSVLPGGPMQFAQGRTYTYAWQNSKTGHTSDLAQGISVGDNLMTYTGNAVTVLSPSLGVAGEVPYGVGYTQIQLTLNPVQPIDPQVDTCLILATSDGGSLENLYQIAQIAIDPTTIITVNYTDTMPDTVTDSSEALSSYTLGLMNGTISANIYPTASGTFTQTSGSTPTFTQAFNSLMFNTHPRNLLPNFGSDKGLDSGSANIVSPFTNQVINPYGQWSSDEQVTDGGTNKASQGSLSQFDMILTGTFVVTAATSISFQAYCNAFYMIGISGATYVSGPQFFGSGAHTYSTTPLNSYPMLSGIMGSAYTWQSSNVQTNTFVIEFPAAGNYPFEICFTAGPFSEKSFNLLADNQVIVAATGLATLNDLTATSYLLSQNLWVESDQFGNVLGIVGNSPPPNTILYPTPHQGRLFATDGKTVFYSKSIDEVTTSTTLITAKWEECWPPENQLPIALDNESVVGLVSDGQTLHIGTTKSIYAMYGDSPENFSIPAYLFQETGVLSADLWNVVYAEGEPAGYMWVTPDFKVMYSDFTTYRDIGIPIYPLLQQWDASYTVQAKLESFTYGPNNLAVLSFKRTGSAFAEFLIYETNMRKWYSWIPAVPGSNPLTSFVYQHPENGYRALFYSDVVSGSTNYRFFNPAQTSDVGTRIPWTVQTGWQDLSDPHALKVLNQLTMWTDEPTQTVSIYAANNQQDFANPVLVKSGMPVPGPLGTLKFYCAGAPSRGRFYSFKFQSGVAAALGPDVLGGFDAEYYPMARI